MPPKVNKVSAPQWQHSVAVFAFEARSSNQNATAVSVQDANICIEVDTTRDPVRSASINLKVTITALQIPALLRKTR